MNKKISTDNHYVSRMYLKAWATNKYVKVCELLVPNDKVHMWKSKSISSICSYDSMFVRLKDGEKNSDIEDWFNKDFENPAKEALEHAINDERMSIDDWHNIINFILCQIVRNPTFLSKILSWSKAWGESAFNEELDTISNMSEEEIINDYNNHKSCDNEKLFPLKIEKVGESSDGKIEYKVETYFGKQFYLWYIKRIINSDISKMFHKQKWGIMNIEHNIVIPTSDNPVICLNYINRDNYDFNGSIGVKDNYILFPISPTKIIYTQIGKKVKSRINVNYNTSLFLKKIIIEHAFRKVISCFEDEEVLKIRKRKVNKEIFQNELEMWEDFEKNYLEKEINFIR